MNTLRLLTIVNYLHYHKRSNFPVVDQNVLPLVSTLASAELLGRV